MKLYKNTKTSKLFFDKFVNKVTVVTPVASEFRNNKMEYTKTSLANLSLRISKSENKSISVTAWTKRMVNETDIKLAVALCNLLANTKSDYAIRVEGPWLGIYSNDDALIDNIVANNMVKEVSKPASSKVRDFLLANPNSIISNKYTHKYRVTVNPLKESSANFHSWAEKIPTIKLLKRTYRTEGYFYASNEKTLGMCRLFLGNKLRRVDTLYLESEI
jgi:hypothetical protein